VTEDWAEAAPAAASTAKATRDFFIASFSKVKQGAPVDPRQRMQAHMLTAWKPGPTSISEVDAIAPEHARFRKVFSRTFANPLSWCNS
jgi:hypothetical protein